VGEADVFFGFASHGLAIDKFLDESSHATEFVAALSFESPEGIGTVLKWENGL